MFSRFFWYALIVACFSAVPLCYVFAQGLTSGFGGRISLITPCVGPYGGSLVVDLEGQAGGRFVWTPLTLTYMYGPPKRIGQNLLGLSGLPSTCPTAYGRRGALINWLSGPGMIMVGSSI